MNRLFVNIKDWLITMKHLVTNHQSCDFIHIFTISTTPQTAT